MTRLILVGAGHAHAQVLKDWITRGVAGTELIVVSPSALAPYSGMVPGWLAGSYRFDEICVNFEALCRAAGARWLTDEASGLDADQRRLGLRSGAVLDYDWLSLNIGSTLTPPAVPQARVLSLRPLGELRAAWEALLADLANEPPDRQLTITAVGGGAAGVESLLAVRRRLTHLQPGWRITGQLLSRSAELLPGMARSAARRVHAALDRASISLRLGTDFDGEIAAAGDLVLWATGAQAHEWPQRSGLALGPTGFIRIDELLRSSSHPTVFAVGDCADWAGPADAKNPADPLPKAGVFAVRMGPVLSNNLRACLGRGRLQSYAPQRRYLALLATADGRAILAWDRFSAQGRWAWRWKDRIDRAFLARFVMDAGRGAGRGAA